MVAATNDSVLDEGKKRLKKVTKALKGKTDILTDRYF